MDHSERGVAMIQLDDEQEQLLREILDRFKEGNRIFELKNALRIIGTWAFAAQTWDIENRLAILEKIEEKCKEVLNE